MKVKPEVGLRICNALREIWPDEGTEIARVANAVRRKAVMAVLDHLDKYGEDEYAQLLFLAEEIERLR